MTPRVRTRQKTASKEEKERDEALGEGVIRMKTKNRRECNSMQDSTHSAKEAKEEPQR